jgi:hypothetical protein
MSDVLKMIFFIADSVWLLACGCGCGCGMCKSVDANGLLKEGRLAFCRGGREARKRR